MDVEEKPVIVKCLDQAANDLAEACDAIDADESGADLDNALVGQFQNALANVAAAVDRRKAFFRRIDAEVAILDSYTKDIAAQKKKLQNLRDRVEWATKRVILAKPEITFKDSLGKKLQVIDNPVPKLVFNFPPDVTNKELDGYTKKVTTEVVDNDKIKFDLLAGVELSFAHLEYGTQLRGLK